MKKLLTITVIMFLTTALFGMKNRTPEFNRMTNHADFELINELKDMGYTVLPEVIVTAYRNPQDTLKHKQRFSSRFETKGGRGYVLPDWANDSTWYPGQKPLKKEVDAIVDTLVKENPDIEVNNYYNDDPFFYSYNIGRFYHGGFNYWYYNNPFYYNPWFYEDFGWGWNPYFGYNNPWYYNDFYFGYNSYWGWNWYRPYYHNNYWYGGHNNFYGYNHQQPQYGRRERPSNLSNTYRTDNRRIQPQKNGTLNGIGRRSVSLQNKPTYSENRRSYQPSYNNPRMSVRPQYNNSRIENNMLNRRSQVNTQSRSQISTERRTYSPATNVQRNTQSRTYSQPSRSYNSGNMNRSSSSNYSQPSRSYNSGNSGTNRSSGGSNFNSGGSRSSGSNSSGSSGSRRR